MMLAPKRDDALVHRLADQLEAALSFADRLMALQLPLRSMQDALSSDEMLDQIDAIRDFVETARALELAMIAKLEISRQHAERVCRFDRELRPIAALFASGIRPLIEAALAHGDRTEEVFHQADQVLPYLKARRVVASALASLDDQSHIRITANFHLCAIVRLGNLIELCDSMLHVLDLNYGLYEVEPDVQVAHADIVAPVEEDYPVRFDRLEPTGEGEEFVADATQGSIDRDEVTAAAAEIQIAEIQIAEILDITGIEPELAPDRQSDGSLIDEVAPQQGDHAPQEQFDDLALLDNDAAQEVVVTLGREPDDDEAISDMSAVDGVADIEALVVDGAGEAANEGDDAGGGTEVFGQFEPAIAQDDDGRHGLDDTGSVEVEATNTDPYLSDLDTDEPVASGSAVLIAGESVGADATGTETGTEPGASLSSSIDIEAVAEVEVSADAAGSTLTDDVVADLADGASKDSAGDAEIVEPALERSAQHSDSLLARLSVPDDDPFADSDEIESKTGLAAASADVSAEASLEAEPRLQGGSSGKSETRRNKRRRKGASAR